MIEEKNGDDNRNNIQMWFIIVLLIIIAIMGFFLWKKSWDNTNNVVVDDVVNIDNTNNSIDDSKIEYEDLSIRIIEDKRCTNCPTDQIITELKKLPSIANIEITREDFSDEGISDYLKENNIEVLPLIVFSTNNFDTTNDPEQKGQNWEVVPKVNTFLEPLKTGKFTLAIWAKFNPFLDRSEKWFIILDTEKLKAIKDNSYIKWNIDAKITWIEYSDLECPFCAKLHNAWTSEELFEKYWDDLNMVYNHFPLGFHANAQSWAEILECLWEEKWSDAYYSLIKKAYADTNSTKEYLIEEAVALGWTKTKIEECLESWKYSDKVKNQMAVWTKLFNITWTPGNILINNETGEYEVVSWAYPTSAFEWIIDQLLK